MFGVDLAIKFGSSEITIYQKGVGIVAKEPAYLAVEENGKKIKVREAGRNAEKLFYSQTEDVSVYKPIQNGEIVDEKMATLLLGEIINNLIEERKYELRISALVAVPCGLNFDQLQLIKKVLRIVGVGKVKFVTNAVCAKSLLDLDPADTIAVVDIGKNITDVTILNDMEILAGRTYQIGGQDMDKSISTFIQDNYDLEVLDVTSEEIKNELSSLYERDMCKTKFIGIDKDNHFRKCEITANEVRLAIESVYNTIIKNVQELIETLDKKTIASIYKNGIVFVGGGSSVAGFYEYLNKKLDANIIIPENPTDNVIMGAGKLLNLNKEFLTIDF